MGLLIIILQFVIVLSAGYARADDESYNITGYDKSIWNMSVSEVLAAESPRIEKLEKPEKFAVGVAVLDIKEIQIGSNTFRALFIFDEKEQKLIQVNLNGYEQKDPSINSMVFSSVEKLLTEKYGPPTFKQESKNISWKLPKTTINLNHLNIRGIMTQVNIIYKPAEASRSESKNL